jgi:hypothetical protein
MKYHLCAKDKNDQTFAWGFDFPTVEAASKALLPETWAIDDDGKEVARRGK